MKKMISILLVLGLAALGVPGLADATSPAETTAPEIAEAAEVKEEAAADPEPTADGEEAPAVELPSAEELEADIADDAETEPAADEGVQVWFEEGFGLTLPSDWVGYPVSEDAAEKGIRYVVGDPEREQYMYVMARPTGIADMEALTAMIDNDADLEKTSVLDLGDAPFVTFIDREKDVSGCATLWRGEIVSFLFTPQSSSDLIMTATQIMESFTVV